MPRGAPKKENPRRAVTYKLPPALLDRIAREHKRHGCKDRTEFVERALWGALSGSVAPTQAPSPPESAQAPTERANAVPVDRAELFRAATQRRA